VYDFQAIERTIDPRSVPGLNIVKIQDGSEIGTYSVGIYGQNNEPVDVDTVYDLASITKLYTTALVLRQVQEGKMDLDDRFNKYLEGQSFKHSYITIRSLLSHRVNFNLSLAQYREKHPNDYKSALLNIHVPDQSSNTVNYHNLGYIYLGYALENVAGRSLEDQMKLLFSDLGLNNTYTGNSIIEAGIKCPATEILSDGSFVESVTHDDSARLHDGLAGNAGVFASAQDLAKFGWAWVSGQVVHPDLFKETLRNYDEVGNSPQGLGWWMRFKNGKKLPEDMYGHHGFTGCYLAINTKTSEVTAITTNMTFFGRDKIAGQTIWQKIITLS
jgi:CubicO group peptidase (beta-lactamase class C family)